MTRRGLFAFAFVLPAALVASCTSLDGLSNDVPANEGGAFESSDDGAVTTTSDARVDANDGGVTCSADLQTDRKNCGACGHDCSNGSCEGGLCTLTTEISGASGLAVHGGLVYLGMLNEDGNIFSCPTNGCMTGSAPLVDLAPDAGVVYPITIAVNDTFLAASNFLDNGGGGIDLIPLAGGPLVRLPGSMLERSFGVAIDSTTVYFTTAGTTNVVHACDLPACAGGLKVVATSNDPSLIAVSASGAIVWAENAASLLHVCASKTACTVQVLVAPLGPVNDLKIQNNTVYWGTTLGGVYSCPVTGCANPTTIVVPDTPVMDVQAIAVSGDDLYWSTEPYAANNDVIDTQGLIRACKISNCTAPNIRTVAKLQHDPIAIELDARSVYWLNSGKHARTDGSSTLMKAVR